MLSVFKIGHFSNEQAGTGCTVILPPESNVASASVRGASPGTRDLALLAPDKKISSIHALVLTGGSAFGLNAAQGIMLSLAAQGIGYQTHYGVVPIVPAAVIFDKNVGKTDAYPTDIDAVSALKNATYKNYAQGNIGAGTGATVGKWQGIDNAMKGGLGIAQNSLNTIKITVLTVVNSVGDIINRDGSALAGAMDRSGQFFASRMPFRTSKKPDMGLAENTVLCAVLMNVKISKSQAFYLAEHAHFGISRRIEPSHTSYDGDVTFVISHPQEEADIDLLCSLMIDTVEQSILNAVKSACTAFGIRGLYKGSPK
jgi:L-aminopeptidase/D-esterase-like protein